MKLLIHTFLCAALGFAFGIYAGQNTCAKHEPIKQPTLRKMT